MKSEKYPSSYLTPTMVLRRVSTRSRFERHAADVRPDATARKDKIVVSRRDVICGGVLGALISVTESLGAAERVVSTARAEFEYARSLALQAFIYGTPVHEMAKLRYDNVFRMPRASNYRPLNAFFHPRELWDHTHTNFPCPSNDTLLSTAWLDLRSGPLELQVPASGNRYYSLHFLDLFTNSFKVMGSRTKHVDGCRLAIFGPDSTEGSRAGVEEVRSPSNTALLLVRVGVPDKGDLSGAREFQNGLRLDRGRDGVGEGGLDSMQDKNEPDLDGPLGVFSALSWGLRENRIPTGETALVSQFSRIGISAERPFDADSLSPDTRAALAEAVQVGEALVQHREDRYFHFTNGWRRAKDLGSWGQDYRYRAHIAVAGLAALPGSEAAYFASHRDANGNRFSGKFDYKLRFDAPPPVTEFWSLSMYKLPERHFIKNPINRYSIASTSRGLVRNEDGSVTINISNRQPAKGGETATSARANWLPAPPEDFLLILRMYGPGKEVFDGTYAPPPVVRIAATRDTGAGGS